MEDKPNPETPAEKGSDPNLPPKALQTMTLISCSGDGQVRAPQVDFGSYEQRYQAEDFIGEGGMGKVYEGLDAVLKRQVALKYLKGTDLDNPSAYNQFLLEALNSGMLDHPCIPPVHDVGVDSNGRPFYVMRLIRGTSLAETLNDTRGSNLGWSLPRLLQVLIQVCGAVQYAHDSKILHLDIKPANIMIGEYEDVYLVDWGLSEHTDAKTGAARGGTRGTPGYMSPEQADGVSQLTPAADCFALGVVLYEIVVGERPFGPGTPQTLLERVRDEDFRRSSSWLRSPPELREILEKTLQKDPENRATSPRWISERLQEFLEGREEAQRRQARAEAALEKADVELQGRRKIQERCEAIRRELETTVVKSWAALEDKQRRWELEDALEESERGADAATERALRHLRDAYQEAPEEDKVRQALGRIYWERFEHAEIQGDDFQKLFLETQLRQLDCDEFVTALQGDGTLTLHCEPVPTTIELAKLVEVDRVLTPTEKLELPASELERHPLPMGSYLVTLRRHGYLPLTAPVFIGRGENVSRQWKLRTREDVESDFQVIPAGPFTMGGDAATFAAVPRQVQDVPEFCIAKYPVTWGEYQEYLQAIADEDREEAVRRLPAVSAQRPDEWTVDQEGVVRFVHENEETRHWPIFQVTYEDAISYCKWRSGRDGRSYRLPTDAEWEKAARGEDARLFPWGNRFDALFCKNAHSTPERAQPEPVGRYSTDVSPYGVGDMAGGIREWCSSWFDEANGHRLVRGGSWNFGEIGAHCAYRLGCSPIVSYVFIGFRLAHDIEPHPVSEALDD